ncbi:ribonuclease kappa-like [Maniola jurtina]|uniref:ribonuclease kappa-like n=1 Tax=Maniola jurtina TaxID=191418 RepID=UPI001E687F3C|nr:ribonuclease kappa-like [Maniola jurtina]
MGILYGCGLCCMLLSIWAVLQLVVMGIFFKLEVLAFIEEAEPDHHSYEDYDDFIKQTKDNYHKIAINCWVAAIIYLITLGLSFWCMKHARAKNRMAEESLKDDEVFCREKPKKS